MAVQLKDGEYSEGRERGSCGEHKTVVEDAASEEMEKAEKRKRRRKEGGGGERGKHGGDGEYEEGENS